MKIIAKRDDGALLVLEEDRIKAFIYFPAINKRTDPMDVAALLGHNRDAWEEVKPADYEETLDNVWTAKFMEGSVGLKKVRR